MVNCAWCRRHHGRIDHPLCSADDMAQRWKDIADAGKGQVAQGVPSGAWDAECRNAVVEQTSALSTRATAMGLFTEPFEQLLCLPRKSLGGVGCVVIETANMPSYGRHGQ